jgi:hypothetical protein
VEEEEGYKKVEEGDELNLVPTSKAPPVELMLSSNGPQHDGAGRSQKKIFINIEPSEAEPGPLQTLVYG